MIIAYTKEDIFLISRTTALNLFCQLYQNYLKKVVFIQIHEYVNSNKLLHKSQYGFRAIHPTELAGIEFIDKILHYLDGKHTPISIFLDLDRSKNIEMGVRHTWSWHFCSNWTLWHYGYPLQMVLQLFVETTAVYPIWEIHVWKIENHDTGPSRFYPWTPAHHYLHERHLCCIRFI